MGRIEGIKNLEANADIIADYGFSSQLKDELLLKQGQFIYSNQSIVPASLNIRIKAKGDLQDDILLMASISVEMKYTLRQIFVKSVTTRYKVKNVRQPEFLLNQ